MYNFVIILKIILKMKRLINETDHLWFTSIDDNERWHLNEDESTMMLCPLMCLLSITLMYRSDFDVVCHDDRLLHRRVHLLPTQSSRWIRLQCLSGVYHFIQTIQYPSLTFCFAEHSTYRFAPISFAIAIPHSLLIELFTSFDCFSSLSLSPSRRSICKPTSTTGTFRDCRRISVIH